MRFLFSALENLHAHAVIQNALAQAQRLGCDFQKFVVCKEFQTLFQTEVSGRCQAQRFVTAGGTHIGQLLLLADITSYVKQGENKLQVKVTST